GGAPAPTTGRRPKPGEILLPSRDATGLADFCDEVVDLHDRLQDLADSQFVARTRFAMEESAKSLNASVTASAVADAANGLDVQAPVVVGPFEISAVRARGRAARGELNGDLDG